MAVILHHHHYGRRSTDFRLLTLVIRGYDKMNVNQKVVFWLRLVSIGIVLLAFLSGKPPSHAQVPVPVTPVISSEDAVQDEKINNLHQFETNQDNWNRDTGMSIATLKDDVSNIKGEIIGVGLALGGLNILGIFFQLKKQKE